MSQVFDRFAMIRVLQHPYHYIAIAAKAIAHLVRFMFVVNDKLHVASATYSASRFLLHLANPLGGQAIPHLKQVVGSPRGAAVSCFDPSLGNTI